MLTPRKGDFPGLALTPAARAVAEEWDPARDEAEGNDCKAYGAPAIMRVPGRLRVSWRDDETLEIQTDAGRQTRMLHFGEQPAPSATPSWQGTSVAEWLPHRSGARVVNGSLKVVTTGAKAGYLRKNGVPYDYHRSLYTIRVTSRVNETGIVKPPHRWTFSSGIRISGL